MSLHEAVINRDIDTIRELLLNKVNPNQNDNRWTPIYYATRKGCVEILNLLIENGAHHNVKDHVDWYPIHEAIYNNDPEIVKVLINNGVDISVKNSFLETPLQLARRFHKEDNIERHEREIEEFNKRGICDEKECNSCKIIEMLLISENTTITKSAKLRF
jgi:ankyrin repeat protein